MCQPLCSALFGVTAVFTCANRSSVVRSGAVEEALPRLDRLREKVGARHATCRTAAEQMRLQRGETIVVHGHRLGQHLRNVPLPLSGKTSVLLALHPVLDVEVGG